MMSVLGRWKESGLLNEDVRRKLSEFADLILEWNPRINLTGFRDRESVENILIGESVRALRVTRIGGRRVLDFGSGAGVPGLVWSICNPEIRLTTLEVRQKKIAFQKEVVRTLDLAVRVLPGRFPDRVMEETFDWIVTRAIRFDPVLWRRAEAIVDLGGGLIRFSSGYGVVPEGWEAVRISEHTDLLFRFKRST